MLVVPNLPVQLAIGGDNITSLLYNTRLLASVQSMTPAENNHVALTAVGNAVRMPHVILRHGNIFHTRCSQCILYNSYTIYKTFNKAGM